MNNQANFARSISIATFALLAALAFALGAPPTPVHAAGFVVNSLADNNTSGDTLCTLREAIQSANNAGNGDCGTNSSVNDTITFSVSGTLPLASTLPDILSGQGTLTIDGMAQNITISGNAAVRVFLLEDPGATLTLQKVTIADGRSFDSDFGGGIVNVGTLNVINSTFSDNNVGYNPFASGGIVFGGGIYNEGTLTVTNSTFSGNNTYGNGSTGPGTFGSGAAIFNAGTASLINSTFSGNEVGAGVGAGIGNSGTLTVINSSFFDNSGGDGAGIYSAGTLTVVNSTFFNNLGFETIQNDGGTVALRNTIVATPTNYFAPNCSGTITDGGGNLQFGGGVANSCGGSITTGDPKLVGHANNGGPTQTMALQGGSAAIDAGSDVTTLNGAIDSAVTTVTVTDGTSIPAGVGFAIQIDSEQMIVTVKASNTLTVTRAANGTTAAGHNDGVGVNPAFDQRGGTGFGRKVGSAVDIGAYEYGVLPTGAGCPVTTSISNATVTFACVSQAGTTTFMPISPASAGTVPNGYTLCASCPAYDITTTATYSPPVTVCLAVPTNIDQQNFSTLKLMHGESGALVDHTTGHFTDTNGERWVCGDVNSLSPFALAGGQTPTAANGTISGEITELNGAPLAGVTINLNGTQMRGTITDANGNYSFDGVEVNGFYTVTPLRVNYTLSPANRSFSLLGVRTEASFTATANGDHVNAIDSTEFFVRQQYLDFLGREPDEAGFNFWVNSIESCGADSQCREVKRIDTSAAFFLSIEFQQTAHEVYRMYDAAYGDISNAPVPLMRSEFKPDTQAISRKVIVNQSGWQEILEQNTQAFALDFVSRARFTSVYATMMAPSAFVDQLFTNAQVTPTDAERASVVSEFDTATDIADTQARARVLRRVAENATLRQQEFDRAFVLMQYFGYLQRDPNTTPDTNFTGFNFWLMKLNAFGGNFQNSEMVKSFLVSGEYRQRFVR